MQHQKHWKSRKQQFAKSKWLTLVQSKAVSSCEPVNQLNCTRSHQENSLNRHNRCLSDGPNMYDYFTNSLVDDCRIIRFFKFRFLPLLSSSSKTSSKKTYPNVWEYSLTLSERSGNQTCFLKFPMNELMAMASSGNNSRNNSITSISKTWGTTTFNQSYSLMQISWQSSLTCFTTKLGCSSRQWVTQWFGIV